MNQEENMGNDGFINGRIILVHKERYIVQTQGKLELDAEITGNLRFTAQKPDDFPVVGDQVQLQVYDNLAIIHKILPRTSLIKRQHAGQSKEIQPIAANVNVAFIMQAVDRDLNINRLERYQILCEEAGVDSVVVLTKSDLMDEQSLSQICEMIKKRMRNIPVFILSNQTRFGYEDIEKFIEKDKIYCLLGSSGVGKSTFLNNLTGASVMKTNTLSNSTSKGKHTTTHRELVFLQNGGMIIDNPGMREVGMAGDNSAVEKTFDLIDELADHCRFKDCTHTNEKGCKVLEALNKGEIEEGYYENYLRLRKEMDYFESSLMERKQKDKAFGKMVKNVKKDLKQIKPQR